MKKKIVIIDDDPSIHEIFKIIFERKGYQTITLLNPDALFIHEYEDAHVYLIDKEMPGIDGLEVCRFLKQNDATRKAPVIIISAGANLIHAAHEAGASVFIEKPFKIKDLLQKIEKCLTIIPADLQFATTISCE